MGSKKWQKVSGVVLVAAFLFYLSPGVLKASECSSAFQQCLLDALFNAGVVVIGAAAAAIILEIISGGTATPAIIAAIGGGAIVGGAWAAGCMLGYDFCLRYFI